MAHRPHISHAICKDSAKKLSWFSRRFLKHFTIYGHSNHFGLPTANNFNNLSFTSPKVVPHEIWKKKKKKKKVAKLIQRWSFENVDGWRQTKIDHNTSSLSFWLSWARSISRACIICFKLLFINVILFISSSNIWHLPKTWNESHLQEAFKPTFASWWNVQLVAQCLTVLGWYCNAQGLLILVPYRLAKQ